MNEKGFIITTNQTAKASCLTVAILWQANSALLSGWVAQDLQMLGAAVWFYYLRKDYRHLSRGGI